MVWKVLSYSILIVYLLNGFTGHEINWTRIGLLKDIPNEYRVRDGAHTWNFWADSLPIGLEFISRSMDN